MLYLIGNGLLNRSLSGRVPPSRVGALVALAALVALTPLGPPNLLLLAAATAVLLATALWEMVDVRRLMSPA
jgi:low temperature requirement protein LtrA